MVEAAWSKKKYCDIQLNTQFRQHILIMSWESRLIIWRVNKTPDKSTCMWIPNTDLSDNDAMVAYFCPYMQNKLCHAIAEYYRHADETQPDMHG